MVMISAEDIASHMAKNIASHHKAVSEEFGRSAADRLLRQIIDAAERGALERTGGGLSMSERIREIEAECREQASGSQDGYLLEVANRLRAVLK